MHRRKRTCRQSRAHRVALALLLVALGYAGAVHAQHPPQAPGATGTTLKQAFDAAWLRQPEAAALQARRDAAVAQRASAEAWTPEPAAFELSNKTDRLHRNRGTRELEVGIAVPLWLPGERARSGALADAESGVVESRMLAAQWRVAGVLRDAYWQWQRSRIDLDVARDQLANARLLAADVGKRLQAGDLARADQHQAEGAVAAAESAVAQTSAAAVAAEQQLRTLVGSAAATPTTAGSIAPEPEPRVDASALSDPALHPAVRELQDRAAVAERNAALTSARSRAHPELTLSMGRERDAAGESYNQTITIGVRIPFGGGSRHVAKTAAAQADAFELQAQAALERERIVAERDMGRLRVESARLQLAAAERRAQLAQESRGFFDKSFRLGETDLPTRLRIEAEAVEARRQAARGRVELAAAISHWRQALGLLPE